jgi:REP element-mobilizing transposase RayT
MARKPRLEVEGGLYHVITRGNDRQVIFHSDQDHARFLSLLWNVKERFPFYLYAYCLMSNHLHLLLERRADTVGKIMQRLLTGYSQYYNRRHRHVGHVFQGRHKAILCQSDGYLAELVRYIHLNPVRARMVEAAENYPHSSQRAYLGFEPACAVDVDPVLRLFGRKKQTARERFRKFVAAGVGLEYPAEFDSPAEGDILGSEEFIDSTIHRIGEAGKRTRRQVNESVCGQASLIRDFAFCTLHFAFCSPF